MKLNELLAHLNKLPADYDVKVSSFFITEGETNLNYHAAPGEQFIAINDESLLGISKKDDMRQIQIIGIQQQAAHFGPGDFSRDVQ